MNLMFKETKANTAAKFYNFRLKDNYQHVSV